jgi:DNA-binding NtrC family response regulator
MMARILVVDDERDIRRALEFVLTHEGYDVETVSNGNDAIEKLQSKNFDIVITDLKMEGISGFAVLEKSLEINSSIPVVIITAYASVESAVEAMKRGAADYIVKPFFHEDIKLTIKRLLEHSKLYLENQGLRQQISQKYGSKGIVGVSESISRVFDTIEKVAPNKANILIYGESGTGKGLVAETIHYNSPRRDKPFIAINCASIPETLLESELFGYKKGAFTGATDNKTGLITLANEGTFFLDEIGDMPLMLQSKLLKVIETGEVLPLGDTKSRMIDVRIISATNKDIEACIKRKEFREDLYYRLDVIGIEIPPLRERTDDIPILADHFLKEFTGSAGKKIKGFEQEAFKALLSYGWPGNIRELRNIVERAVVLSNSDTIALFDLPEKVRTRKMDGGVFTPSGTLKSMLNVYEKELIMDLLRKNRGNKELTVKTLGIDLATLYRKLHKYDIKL